VWGGGMLSDLGARSGRYPKAGQRSGVYT
jgi:hypothetical protein